MDELTTSGADTQTTVADQSAVSAQIAAGAETLEQSAEIVGSEDTTGQEATGPEETTTLATMQPHQTTLEERVQQMVEKRLADMEAKLAQKQEETPPFAPDEQVASLQGMITSAILRENQILSELNLEDDPRTQQQLAAELRQIRKWLPQAEDALEKDSELRKEWERKRNESDQQKKFTDNLNARMDQAQELYRREMNIPENIWTSARDFFQTERAAHPLLNRQYLDVWERRGEIAALDFAKEYCEKNMGKKQELSIQQKEQAKALTADGKTSTGVVFGNPEIAALREKAKSGHAEDLANYSAAKAKLRLAA